MAHKIEITYEKQEKGMSIMLYIDGNQNCSEVLRAITQMAEDFKRRFFDHVISCTNQSMGENEVKDLASRIMTSALSDIPAMPIIGNTGANA